MSKQNDLTKVSIITILGLSILIFSLFWLKGHKLYNLQKIKVYFEDVSGLEEGSIVRWSGLRVGVVEDIKPVIKNFSRSAKPREKVTNEFTEESEKELKKIEDLKSKFTKTKDEKLNEQIKTLTDCANVHLNQGLAYEQQKLKESKNHVEVTLVITKKDVPLGPLSTISIVPSGLIGEQYVEISPNINRLDTDQCKFKSIFVTKEPLRFERFLKANIDSAEAFKEAVTKVNTLLNDKDVELLVATIQDARGVVKSVNSLVDNASVLLSTTSEKLDQLATSSNKLSTSVVEVGENINQIIGDEQVRENLKSTTSSLNIITTKAAQLLDEQGLAKDIAEIGQTAKETTHELSSFVKDLRQAQEELGLPETLSNLNSLSTKLDKLAEELNGVVADEEFKENIKITAEKARKTSENLEKISKKYSKRFLLFRLLF